MSGCVCSLLFYLFQDKRQTKEDRIKGTRLWDAAPDKEATGAQGLSKPLDLLQMTKTTITAVRFRQLQKQKMQVTWRGDKRKMWMLYHTYIKGIKMMSYREESDCAKHGEVLRWSADSEGEQTIDKLPQTTLGILLADSTVLGVILLVLCCVALCCVVSSCVDYFSPCHLLPTLAYSWLVLSWSGIVLWLSCLILSCLAIGCLVLFFHDLSCLVVVGW